MFPNGGSLLAEALGASSVEVREEVCAQTREIVAGATVRRRGWRDKCQVGEGRSVDCSVSRGGVYGCRVGANAHRGAEGSAMGGPTQQQRNNSATV